MSYSVDLTNIDHRVQSVYDQPDDRLRAIAVLQLHEIGLLQDLVSSMALNIDRDEMPPAERVLLDMILDEGRAT